MIQLIVVCHGISMSFFCSFRNYATNLFHQYCTIAQGWLSYNGKYHEQHDTLHGHMRDTKNITQIDDANQQSHTTAYPDNPAKQIQRLADMIQNHKSHNGKEHGTGSGNVRLIDTKDSAEDYQCTYHKEICQSRRQSFDQNIGQEPSVNGFCIWLQGKEKTGDSYGKHTDQ